MKKHFLPTLKFSLPIIFSRSGAQLLTILNVAMLGQYGEKELANFSLISSPYFTFLLIVLCLTSAIPISVAKHKTSPSDLRRTFLTSVIHWTSLSLAFVIACTVFAFYFEVHSSLPNVTTHFQLLAVSAPWFVGVFVLGTILEALGKAKANALITFLAIPTNYVLNLLALHFLTPTLDTVSAIILSMGATRFIMCAALFLTLRKQTQQSFLAKPDSSWLVAFKEFLKDLRFGAPIAFAYGLRNVGITLLLLFLAELGDQDVATFSIANQLIMLSTLITRGVAAASIIRISEFLGKNLTHEIDPLIKSSIAVTVVLVIALCIPIGLFPHSSLSMFTKSAAIVGVLSSSIAFLFLIFLTDCVCGVLAGALRPVGDPWIPQLLCGLAVVIVPFALKAFVTVDMKTVFATLTVTQSLALAAIVARWYRFQRLHAHSAGGQSS